MSCGAQPSHPEVFELHARDQRAPTWRQAKFLEAAAKRNGKTVRQLIRAGIEHKRLHDSTPCPSPGPDDSAKFVVDVLTRSQAQALFEVVSAWDSTPATIRTTECSPEPEPATLMQHEHGNSIAFVANALDEFTMQCPCTPPPAGGVNHVYEHEVDVFYCQKCGTRSILAPHDTFEARPVRVEDRWGAEISVIDLSEFVTKWNGLLDDGLRPFLRVYAQTKPSCWIAGVQKVVDFDGEFLTVLTSTFWYKRTEQIKPLTEQESDVLRFGLAIESET